MSIKANLKTCLVISMFLLVMVSTAAGQIIYVDADATGSNDGSSWADACKYLQDALAVASSGDQIWVAEGIYKPDQDSNHPNGAGTRQATFQLKSGVAIYGGFPSGGGKWEDSNPSVYETILSGDLDGDDVGDLEDISRGENSYSVVTGTKADATAVLDGFTITAGRAYGRGGGGMCNRPGNPIVRNCAFRDNLAKLGGGVWNSNISKPSFINCTFIGNSAKVGGGMHNGESRVTLSNCIFIGNSAETGGGIHNHESDPTLTNCVFIGNLGEKGGGMYNWTSKPTLTNCTFGGNSAKDCGGGVHNQGSCATLTNCILWNNKDSNGIDESAQIVSVYGVQAVVNYCCIQGWTGDLGGAGNIGLNPLFVDMDKNDYHLLPGSPCIDAGDNTALPSSVVVDIDGNPRFIDGNGDGSATVDMGTYEYER